MSLGLSPYKYILNNENTLSECRTELIQKSKSTNNIEIQEEIEAVEEELATFMGKENRDRLFETFAKLDQSDGESFSNGIW